MSYTPNNLAVYLKAFAGCLAGLGARVASSSYNPNESGYSSPATQADAFAQEVDTLWGSASYTSTDLDSLQSGSQAIWADRSPLATVDGSGRANYSAIAAAVVALVQEGTAQVNAEGLNPSGVTVKTVTGGQTYSVVASDAIIKFDSSNGSTPTANLPASPTLGEAHTFFWFAWSVAQVPPVISAGAKQLTPWGGMSQSGSAGLVGSTTISTPGGSITYRWDGAEWLQVA